MNIALLTISSLSLVVSTGTFLVMLKTAHELKAAKIEIEKNVNVAKSDFARKAAIVKNAIQDLEL
jgi:hypothetical protein